MYVGRDFDPSDTGESERFTLDFINDLQDGDTIASVTWTCKVAAKSDLPDDNAAAHISGAAVNLGTRSTQRVTGMVAGATYVLTAAAITTKLDTLSLWSHVECKGPA